MRLRTLVIAFILALAAGSVTEWALTPCEDRWAFPYNCSGCEEECSYYCIVRLCECGFEYGELALR